MGEAIIVVYQAFRDTQEVGHNCVSVGFTAEFMRCP